MGHLDLNQARRVQGLSRARQPPMDRRRTPATEQDLHHHRRVEDDQRRSLSSRNIRTIVDRAATGRNRDSRARISAGAGLSLDRCISTSR